MIKTRTIVYNTASSDIVCIPVFLNTPEFIKDMGSTIMVILALDSDVRMYEYLPNSGRNTALFLVNKLFRRYMYLNEDHNL